MEVARNAFDLASKGSNDEALLEYNRALETYPNLPNEVRFNRAIVLDKLDRDLAAVAALEDLVRDQPGFEPAWFQLGVIAGDLGDFATAQRAFNESLTLRPDNPPALASKALLFAKTGRPDSALVAARSSLALNSANPFAWHIVSASQDLASEGALAAIDSALAYSPQDPHFHVWRGMVLTARERLDEAMDSFDRALSYSPCNPGALLGRGLILMLSNPQDALIELNTALDRADSDASPWPNGQWPSQNAALYLRSKIQRLR